MNILPNCIRSIIVKQPPSSKNLTNTASNNDLSQRSIQICLLGGHTDLGKMTCFLLKQNPLIASVKLQGEKEVENIRNDLDLIDTKCRVEAFTSKAEIPKALRGVDIVLILKEKENKENTPFTDRVMSEAKRVYDIAKECTFHAPRSLILVTVPPVSVFTPVVANVFKKSNFYTPERIIGSAAIAQITLNTMVARYHNLDPFACHVPIVGGPDMDLAVPLFSRAKPVELNYSIAECLTGSFRQVKSKEFPKKHCKKDFFKNHDLGEAFALNNMISTICYGLMGDKKAFYNAFIRTNIVPSCRYLVTTLQFGIKGVSHNCGLPQLTNFELDMLERAIVDIAKREQMAKEIVECFESSCEVPSFASKSKGRNNEKVMKN